MEPLPGGLDAYVEGADRRVTLAQLVPGESYKLRTRLGRFPGLLQEGQVTLEDLDRTDGDVFWLGFSMADGHTSMEWGLDAENWVCALWDDGTITRVGYLLPAEDDDEREHVLPIVRVTVTSERVGG